MFCGHRMVPGWHQSTPRPPRGRRDSGSVFRMLMGKASSPKLKARRHKRDSARGKVVRWKATQSHMNATYKPPSSHVVGRVLRPSCDPKATHKHHPSSDKAIGTRAALKSVRAIPKPRPEDRRPKEIRRPKAELIATPAEQQPIESGHFQNSDFGLLSGFGLRSSDFRAAEHDLPSTGRTLVQPCHRDTS